MRTRKQPNQKAKKVAPQPATSCHSMMAPEGPDAGVLGDAVQAGNYQAFRQALTNYEEWLRKRVGRWIQRYPEAQARVGRGLAIGDVLETVYLNAFEQYAH